MPVIPNTQELRKRRKIAATDHSSMLSTISRDLTSHSAALVHKPLSSISSDTTGPLTGNFAGLDWVKELRNIPREQIRSQIAETFRDRGSRKKSSRFDIPPERNLLNIDQLIANSTDEDEIKELKQQKRLLRNRQAALDSRQRMKQRLEDEKKDFI